MLKTRVITALTLGLAFLACLFLLPPLGWWLFVAGILTVAAWEWQRLAGMDGLMAHAYAPVTALLFLFVVAQAQLCQPLLVASSLFWLLMVPFWLRFKWSMRSFGAWRAVLGWFLLIPAGVAMVVLRGAADGGLILLAAMAVAWIADSFAYFTGRKWGRRKLAPTISPGKSWEGVLGGLLAVVIYLLLLRPTGQLLSSTILALALTAVSVMGDLLESLFKRQADMKDSSNLLPGHGGVLDRVDSLLAILPIAALVSLYPTILNF
jgi:phosphatidate cytidylyltransferase